MHSKQTQPSATTSPIADALPKAADQGVSHDPVNRSKPYRTLGKEGFPSENAALQPHAPQLATSLVMLLAGLAKLARTAPTDDVRSALMLFEEELVARRIAQLHAAQYQRAARFDRAACCIAEARVILAQLAHGETEGYVEVTLRASQLMDADAGSTATCERPSFGGQHGSVVAP